jgi:hypothetical protein
MVDNLEASIGRANSNEWLDDIERQYVEGMADGLVKQYDDEFLGRLRQIKHAGVPLSLIALARPKQAAYQLRDDTARLLMAGCNDSATYFYGKINRLDMAFGYDPNVSCSWIEQDGWVIDATAGWMVEQDLF